LLYPSKRVKAKIDIQRKNSGGVGIKPINL
jgi:hypothetical protein